MKSSAADTSRGRKTDVSMASMPPPKRRGTGRETEERTGKEKEEVKEVPLFSKYKFDLFAFLINILKYTLNPLWLSSVHPSSFWF